MTRPRKIYFARPLFTQGEWLWNVRVVAGLRELGLDVVLPQERSEVMMNGDEQFNPVLLFDGNVLSIDSCDAVVAILDQTDPDSGTAWECGYAYKSGKPIVGIRTDFRAAGDDGKLPVNLMIARSCSAFVELPINRRGQVDWLVEQIKRHVDEIVK